MNSLKFPLIGAHTGGGKAPDNTMESFLEGVDSGADIVEIDLRVTADGTVVLLHDHSPLLEQYTYDQLNQPEMRVQLSSIYEQSEIVKLSDVLTVALERDVKLNLDIKYLEAVEPTMQLVRSIGAQHLVYVTGCSEGITERYKDIRVVYNTPDLLSEEEIAHYTEFAERICAQAAHEGAYGLNMSYNTCAREIVACGEKQGLAVWVYTVNDADDMAHFIDIGVTAITTCEPELLLSLKASK
ncbi:glycerophosphodiester phosphodiesterase [Paenibacillus marinisediminis]